jgi:ATP-dependent helicase IRC3
MTDITLFKNALFARMLRTARWRREPATESQKAIVLKRWGKRLQTDETESTPEQDVARLTRGEAANIITRLKHGALVCHEISGSHIANASLSVTL